jgi:hypothetical protein
VAVLACVVAVALSAPVAVTAVLGIALFAAPGYLLSELLLGPRVVGLERVTVAAGLAFCVPILGGLLLFLAKVPLRRESWLALLAGVTLAADLALLSRRWLSRRHSGPEPPSQHTGRRLPTRHIAAYGAAVVIAAGAVGLARVGAAKQHYPGFTQLWLARPSANALNADLGVGNHEGKTMRYRLVILHNGHPAAAWNLTLANGQTWQRSPAFSGHFILTANLYRLPDTSQPYRHVDIVGNGTPNP